MGNKTRIAAAAVSAVMALSVVPQAAFATNGDEPLVNSFTKTTSRLGGLDRAQTATKIADAFKVAYSENEIGSINTVILTVGRDFPDALAATPLADQLNAPILLNDGARLNAPTSKWIFDNAARITDFVIVGGSGVVPQSVLDDIKAVYVQVRGEKVPNLQDPTFTRYSGVDRNETAYQVSARTVAGYYAAGECTSTGASVSYTAKQVAAAAVVETADAQLADAQADLAAYKAALAAYEAAKAAYDKAIDDEAAALKAYEDAQAALQAITDQLKSVPAIDDLRDIVDAQSEDIAQDAAALRAVQALNADLEKILDAAVAAGAEPTEGTVWENVLNTTWELALEDLPELSAEIARVRAAFGGATIGDTKDNADTAVDTAQENLADRQAAYAEAVKNLVDAIKADEANKALFDAIAAASAKVVAAREAYEAAQLNTQEKWAEYDAARQAYAALVVTGGPAHGPGTPNENMAILEGNVRRAQAEVNKALDAVVALADNVPVFAATGRDFADALTAGPAAADQCGVILLTENTVLSPATNKWISTAKPKTVVAVGGQARTALGTTATMRLVGKDRFETAQLVNQQFLSDRAVLGIATGYDYPDALTGASLVANADGGMLLVRTTDVPAATVSGINGGGWTKPVIFGGTGVVSPQLSAEIHGLMN